MSTPGPHLGPCEAWIDGGDVAACCTVEPGSNDLFEMVAVEASMALFEISGRLFTGACERVVRPCRATCSCWGPLSAGVGPWFWSSAYAGAPGWFWRDECGDRCGCGTLSKVKLAGYPVVEVTAVLIGADVVDPDSYRLDGRRWLVRLSDPGPPARPRYWPRCQDMSLQPGDPGTFTVSYTSGVAPPELGRRAASELACQLAAACSNQDCLLPAGVTKVERQGITIERQLLANWLDPARSTGLVATDLFLQAYWAGKRSGRRPAVFSPDVQEFARQQGV